MDTEQERFVELPARRQGKTAAIPPPWKRLDLGELVTIKGNVFEVQAIGDRTVELKLLSAEERAGRKTAEDRRALEAAEAKRKRRAEKAARRTRA